MTTGKHLKAKEFKQIKALTKTGLSIHRVAEVTGRSASMVWRVRNCKNFTEYDNKYHAGMHARWERDKKEAKASGSKLNGHKIPEEVFLNDLIGLETGIKNLQNSFKNLVKARL